MIFTTIEFVVFFVVFLLGAIFLKSRINLYKWYLLLGSLIFYGYAGVHLLYLLAFVIIINYLLTLLINSAVKKKVKPGLSKLTLVLAILVNIFILIYFKYGNFISNQLLTLNETVKLPFPVPIIELYITIGLSYYIFKVIAHHVDFYKGIIRLPSFLDYSVYLSFFPQVLMGPIQKPILFYRELNSSLRYNYDISQIIVRIFSGILKKLVIASFLFEIATVTFYNPVEFSRWDLIISVFAYGAMLFADFSGYSDFSVALSNILGFTGVENFNAPYKAIGFKDFWSRWHISLSQWFKEYVYIPLGGNRGGTIRKYLNLFITMVVSGVWHGVGFTFLIWGAYHGICSIVSHMLNNVQIENIVYKKILKVIAWFSTLLGVHIGWIFFASRSIDTAFDFIKTIFKPIVFTSQLIDIRVIALIILVILGNFYGHKVEKFFVASLKKIKFLTIIIILIVTYVLLELGPDLVAPFVYFSF